MNAEQLRESFEAWATGQNLIVQRASNFDKDEFPYDYVSNTTETAWLAWLESTRQAAEQVEPSPFREPFTNPASSMGIRKP